MIDLDELERLEREATPGPWGYRVNPHGGARVQTGSVGIADVLSRGGVPHPVQEHCEANARLIATARNELPDLIAELRTLRARVAEMERDARLGAVVRKAVGCMNAHMIEGHTTSPGFTHRQERIISVHQLNVLRAIADALRAEEGGEHG